MSLKKSIAILQRISPKLTAQIAFNFISKPEKRGIRTFEKEILEIADKNVLLFNKFKILILKGFNGFWAI